MPFFYIQKVKVTREEYQVYRTNKIISNTKYIKSDGDFENRYCYPETTEVIEDFRPANEIETALIVGRFLSPVGEDQ